MERIESGPPLLTPAEAAQLLRINRATLDRWVREGKVPAPVKLGGAVVRHRRDALLRHLAACETSDPLPMRTRKATRRAKARSRK